MNSFCEFISKIAPIDAATVQAWAATITAFIAFGALFSWRRQKKYELISEGKANVFKCLNIYKTLLNYEQILYDNMDGKSFGCSPSSYFKQSIIPYLSYGSLVNISKALKTNNEKLKESILILNYDAFKIISFKELFLFSRNEELVFLKNYYAELLGKLTLLDINIDYLDVIILSIESCHKDEEKYLADAKEFLNQITSAYPVELLKLKEQANSLFLASKPPKSTD